VQQIKYIFISLILMTFSSVAIAGDWSKIRIGTEGAYEPWNFTDSAGNIVGAEIDLANDLCKRMNAECEFVQQDWDGIIPALTNGKYDVIMAGMSITEERMETISFSNAYFTEPARLATLKGAPLSTFEAGKSLDLGQDNSVTKGTINAMSSALQGYKLGVTVATIHENFANEYLDVDLKVYQTQDEMNLDLTAGRIDAMLCDVGTTEALMETPSGANVALVGPNIFGGLLGAGVGAGIRQDNGDLKAMFDDAIAASIADGTAGKIATKWFGKDITP
jgi:octopine/nopaline transport system substrate-binding protein